MSYKINENYGKRAYIELENIKKDLYGFGSNCIGNNENVSVLKIFGTDTIIEKVVDVSGNYCTPIVNIYNNTDKNCKLKILINNILIFSNTIDNFKNIKIPLLSGDNSIEVVIANDEGNLIDLDIVFEGFEDKVINKIMFQELDGKYYVAYPGFGETIIHEYLSLNDLISKTYASTFIVPISLLDLKIIKDSSYFVGKTLVLLGKNSNNLLRIYSLQDNFVSEVISLDLSCDDAKIFTNNERLYCYYILGGNIYFNSLEDGFTNSDKLNISKIFFDKIFTMNLLDDDICSESYLICRDIKKKLYLISHNVSSNETINLIYLGNYNSGSIYLQSGTIDICLNKALETTHKSVSLVDGEVTEISKVDSYKPCNTLFVTSTNKVIEYNNCFTVK